MKKILLIATFMSSFFVNAQSLEQIICDAIVEKSLPPLTVVVGGPTHTSSVRACIDYGKFNFRSVNDTANQEDEFSYVRHYYNLDGSYHSSLKCSGIIRYYADRTQVKKLVCL